MEFQLLTDPIDFRDRTRLLLADEASNNLMLGILNTVIDNPDAYEDYRVMVVVDGNAAVAAALITTPPQNLIVAAGEPGSELTALADGVLQAGIDVPRVIGIRPVVDAFVDYWKARIGGTSRLVMAQGVYALEEVIPVPVPQGFARRAGEPDGDRVFEWTRAFSMEALPDEPSNDARLRRAVNRRLRGEKSAGIWLWEFEGETVSMSSQSGPTGSGIRINAVYTPPEHRRNGYASALVAAQSQALLDEGYRFCFLFTDLSNATSNKIYESIGYRRVAEAALFEVAGIDG
jgi:uncharacterized protein